MIKAITVTQEAVDWLKENRITVAWLKPGDQLLYSPEAEVEPYVVVRSPLGVYTICSMGFMSFSNSDVAPDLQVGRYCSIAEKIRTSGFERHPMEYFSTSPVSYSKTDEQIKNFLKDNTLPPDYWKFFPKVPQKPPPVIENDVWIGVNVSIYPGVRIATGSVVAANSVVTKSVGPYEIVGGNPARLIKKRFDANCINLLMQSEWWKYKFTDFKGLPLDNPLEFAEKFLEKKKSLEPYVPTKVRLADIPIGPSHFKSKSKKRIKK